MHINHFPHEVLSCIFATIADDLTMDPICLFPITNVCSRWRTVGLSTGKLWSRIALTCPLSPDYPSCILAFLLRSGEYPLDILMDLRDPCWGWNEDDHCIGYQEMRNIASLLLPHVRRWRRIELLTDTWAPIVAFLECSQCIEQAPMLEKVCLSRCNAYFAASGQTFQPSSLSAPLALFGGISPLHLQTLALVGVHLDWDCFPRLPDLHLLEFKYHSSSVMPSFTQFRSILDKCPILSALTIFGWGPIINNDISRDVPICLPNVTTLSLGVLDTTYAIIFLSSLELPLLDSLVLEDMSKVVNPMSSPDTTLLFKWFCSHRNRFIMPHIVAPDFARSRCPLERIISLELREIHTDKETFVMFLQEVPSVMRLGIFAMANEMLEVLIVSSAHPSSEGFLLPRMKELYCQDVDPEAILKVLSSRSTMKGATGTALKNVTLEYSRGAPPPQGSWLHRELISAGVEIFSDSTIESIELDDNY